MRADRAGIDSLWTWDHLNAIVGPWEQPILEGWTTLAAWSQVTTRATLGLMVGANTFRNPGLTVKMAATLDHLSGGRSVLGLGGAWFGREHEAFGIDFRSGFGERLDALDEAVMLSRRLLDGERIDRHEGRFYAMTDALCEPRPVQARLPIMIGGSGPKKTLLTTAKYADAWNTSGTLAEVDRPRRDPAGPLRGDRPRPRRDRADAPGGHDPPRRPGGGSARARCRARGQRRLRGVRRGPVRLARVGGGAAPAVCGGGLHPHPRGCAPPVRRRDARPPARGPERCSRADEEGPP